MSVMERMRTGTDSPFMMVVFGAVVISFVVLGVGSGSSTTAASVATVNGEAITGVEYNQAYRNAEAQASARSKNGLTDDARAALRTQVIDELVQRKAVLQEAQRLGLEVSAAEIAEELFKFPNLVDDKGVFDRRAFENFLRRQGLTRGDFEEQLREALLGQKLERLMILGASVSDAAVQRSWIESSTKLDLAVVRVRPSAFGIALNPTEAELDAWIGEHADTVQARYDLDLPTRYDRPETLDVRVIRLAVRDDALGLADLKVRLEATRAELEGGADFAAVAARLSEDPSAAQGGLVSALPVTDLDADVAADVQKLQPGELSPVLTTSRDVRIYRLEGRTAARTIPFDEVKREIGLELYRDTEAPARAAAFAETELIPAWTSADAPPTDLLMRNGLEVQSTGLVSRDEPSLLRPPAAMLRAARAATVGAVLPEVFEENGILWVGAVVNREDPDLATFEQDKPRIREMALMERRGAFFEGWVDDVVARANVSR